MYKDILSSLNSPILVVDKKNIIKYVNNSSEEFFSTSKNFLLNKSLDDHIDKYSPLFLLINRSRKNNQSLSENSLKLSSKNFEKNVSISIFPFINDEAKVVIQINVNKTNEKLILHKINNKIASSFSNLVSMLLHELKNPLAGIVGASQLLENDLIKKEQIELVKLVNVEAKRINKLLSNMEVIASGKGYIESSFVNIHEVLNHCKNVAINSFGKNIIFNEVYDPSLPEIKGNYDLLVQVFLNLIKNACEAQRYKGEVLLKTSFQTRKILNIGEDGNPEYMPLQIEIIDYGEGIKDEILPNIFDPFVSTKKNGNGLGLSIVSSVLNTFGGIVDVTSNEKETNFCINFPLKKRY